MSWDKSNIDKLLLLANKNGAYSWICTKSAKYYARQEKYAAIAIIIATALLGGGGIPSLAASNDIHVIRIVNGIIQGLILVLAICKTILEYLDLSGTREEFIWYSAQYNSLFAGIQKTLLDPKKIRPSFPDYYKEILERENDLMRYCPEFPAGVLREYYDVMGKKAIAKNILFEAVAAQIDFEEGHGDLNNILKSVRELKSKKKSEPLTEVVSSASPRYVFEQERYYISSDDEYV